MNYPIKNAPPSDLAERIFGLGDPTGRSMRALVEELGLPQYYSMGPENIINNKPFILIWFTDEIFYPLLFGADYVCIGCEKYLFEIMNSEDIVIPPPSPRPPAE